MLAGYCTKGQNGLYVHDHASFFYCVEGVSQRQECAPGTRHSLDPTKIGKYFSREELCNVNLQDHGYIPAPPVKEGYH